jgi:hypothetical protein
MNELIGKEVHVRNRGYGVVKSFENKWFTVEMKDGSKLYTTASQMTIASIPIVTKEKIKMTKEIAREWLDRQLRKYGNTCYFPATAKARLDKLIIKFGNTYFW